MNIAEALEIKGPLDEAKFIQAMQRLANDLEAARVAITEEDGLPWQYIREHYHGETPLVDVSTAAEPLQQAREWMLAQCQAPVDLAQDPLWRNALFRLGDHHYVWYQQAHHVIYDGFSGGLAARRLAQIYTALAADEPIPDSGFSAYTDLIDADQAYRHSPRYQRDRTFWKAHLAELPEAVSLSRQGRHRNMGGLRRSTAYVPAAQVKALAELGRSYGASLPQVLISAVAAYYHRVTGANDLVIGMPVAARVNARLRSIPGMVANAVAIRLHFQPLDDAVSLLQQVAQVVRQALRHQQYRYEDVRRDLGLLGQDRHMAWLGVNIEPFDYRLDFAGNQAAPMNLSNGSVEDLTVFFYERGDGRELRFDFDANPALYSQAELDQHAQRLHHLITQLLTAPQQRIDHLDLLLPEERSKLLTAWAGQPQAPISLSLPARVKQWAAETPEQMAIFSPHGNLSYAQLQRRIERVASLLDGEGVQVGDRVAVALRRDPWLIVSLLALMQLGATYVPLDLTAPKQRNALILEQAAPTLLLMDAADAAQLDGVTVPRLQLPQVVSELGASTESLHEMPADQADPERLAYILFTSGSTGRPKGVEITQKNLLSFLESMQQELAIKPTDRFLAQTTLIFDIAGLELYLPLLQGASLVLADDAAIRQPRQISQLITAHAVSHVQATPSLWRLLLSARQLDLQSVHVLVGGEALPLDLARDLWQRAKAMSQVYGPTETTIWSTIYHVNALPTATPPIGRPLANTSVYILDPAMQPVITGAVGELWIGGYGVAAGYINQPKLTSNRFIKDPWGDAEAKLYRSGDHVRWTEAGDLEFIGRIDEQCKIRGHRIELGEIEHHLLSHPAILMAAVIPFQPAQGDVALAGYISLHPDAEIDMESLRQYLAERLPSYMLPSSLQTLAGLPLTPNGKLDRKALPTPTGREVSRIESAPIGPLEQQLAEIWTSTLGLTAVGRHDNFFDLGGDSLTAAQMLTHLSEQYGRDIPLGRLFSAATIAELAEALQHEDEATADPFAPLLRLRAGQQQIPLFCIHPVVGIGWAYTALLPHLDTSIPVYSLQAHALSDHSAQPESLQAMAASYVAAIQKVQAHGPYRLLGWSLGGLLVQAMAAQLQAQGEQIELLVMLDAYPFVSEATTAGSCQLSEAEQALAALQFLGVPLDQAPPTTMQAVADHLCAVYGIQDIPAVQALQHDDPDLLSRVAKLTQHHLELARQHRPPQIKGRVLYFQASPEDGVDVSRVLHYQPSAWHTYIPDGMEVHKIDCAHQAMLEPRFAAQIAAVINLHLDPLASGPEQCAQRTEDAVYA